MAIYDKITQARKEGYSDREIIEYLSSQADLKPKIDLAIKEGYEDKDIVEFLGKTAVVSPVKKELVKPFLAGMGGELQLAGQGVAQKLAQLGEGAGMVESKTVQDIQRSGMETREALEQLKTEHGLPAKAGAFVGQAAPSMAIPGSGWLTAPLAGAAQGLLTFTGPGESSTTNAAMGAFGGLLGKWVTYSAGKTLNALTGNVQKPGIRELGEKFRIPTTLGEEIGNPHIIRAETWMERVPFIGLRGVRKQQEDAAENASKAFLSKYVRDKSQGVMGQLENNRKAVSALYEEAKTLVKKLGAVESSSITTNNLADSSTKLLQRYPDIFKEFGDRKLESLLNNIIQDTGVKTATSPIFDEFGKPILTKYMEKISVDDMNFLRQTIGEMAGKLKAQLQNPASGVTKEKYAMFSELLGSIEKDVDKWLSTIKRPDIKEAFKKADLAYKNNVIKYGKIEQAIDNATDAEGLFSPKKFSNWLDTTATKEKYYGDFTKAEKEEMAGLANILSVVKRAGQYRENPPTGARLAEPGAVMAAIGLVKTVPYAITARILSTTEAGKNLVIAASKIEPSSPAMKVIVKQVERLIQRTMAIESINLQRGTSTLK